MEKEISFSRLEVCSECQGIGESKGLPVPIAREEGKFVTLRLLFWLSSYCSTLLLLPGRGWITEDTCPLCRGNGKVKAKRKIKVKIPAGVDSGHRLRVAGEGGAGENGGPSGDLYVYVEVRPHPILERKGSDLYYDLELSYPQLVLGDEVEIPTLRGPEKIRIPAGTESGTSLRLRGKGLPDPQSGSRGRPDNQS